MDTIRLFISLTVSAVWLYPYGQITQNRSLPYYLEAAKANSPLIKDYKNQSAIQQAELQRLKAMYTHSQLELNGDYLFVPIVSKDDGRTTFKWNAQCAKNHLRGAAACQNGKWTVW